MSLLAFMHDFCADHGDKKTYWIAYSGGLDSHVLLAVLSQVRATYPIQLRAIHINHGLSPNAKLWAAHCQRMCEIDHIAFAERFVQITSKQGHSVEETAREKRYAIFAQCLSPGDFLLTAHHEDDQAETLLLQLIRGAGLKGLAAMPQKKPLGVGYHLRPFLGLPRALLQQYADLHQLQYIQDETNTDKKFTRNFIRHDILTTLKMRWPTVTKTLARSAKHCAEAQRLLEELAPTLIESAQGSQPNTLSVEKLLGFALDKQKLILRCFIRQLHFPLPSTKKLMTIITDVLHADWDSVACVNWSGTELRRYRDNLYLMTTLLPHDVSQVFHWQLTEALVIEGIGMLSACQKNTLKCNERVTVRFRRLGESVALSKRGCHSLKKLFQEWHVPPWQRHRIPLLFRDNKLLCAVGCYLDPDFAYEITLETQATRYSLGKEQGNEVASGPMY